MCIRDSLQSQLLHSIEFNISVFRRISLRHRNRALLLGKRPDDTLACRKYVRLCGKYWILEGFQRIDEFPPFTLEHHDKVVEEQSIQQVIVRQERMVHYPTGYSSCQRVVVLGTVPHMLKVEVAITLNICFRIFLQSSRQSLIY